MARKSDQFKELQDEIETDYLLDDMSEEEDFENELEPEWYDYTTDENGWS